MSIYQGVAKKFRWAPHIQGTVVGEIGGRRSWGSMFWEYIVLRNMQKC